MINFLFHINRQKKKESKTYSIIGYGKIMKNFLNEYYYKTNDYIHYTIILLIEQNVLWQTLSNSNHCNCSTFADLFWVHTASLVTNDISRISEYIRFNVKKTRKSWINKIMTKKKHKKEIMHNKTKQSFYLIYL